VFNGVIYFLEIFDTDFDTKLVKKMLAKGDPLKPKPPASGDPADNVPLVGVLLTLDDRVCLSVCTTNELPGTPNAPSPPTEAQLGQPDYGPGATVEEGLPEEKGQAAPITVESIGVDINCDTTGDDKIFAGPTGKQFRIQCPKGCGKLETGTVIGSMIYVDESSVCKSAVHSGFLEDKTGGEFLFIIANGEQSY